MIEPILYGLLAGTVAGVLPGIGVFVTLLLSFPFLLKVDIIQIILFYVAVASTTQYIGSVPATYLGLPGENSSLPALYEGHTMFKKGQGAYAISGAAFGSLFGALFIILLLVLLAPFLNDVKYMLTTYKQTVFLFLTILILILSSKSKWYVAIALAGVGLLLGAVGCSEDYCIMPPGFEDDPNLKIGLPLMPILSGIFVFPSLLETYETKKVELTQDKPKLLEHFKKYCKNISPSIRGTLIGSFLGALPGSGQTVCANLSYRLEMFLNKSYKRGDYRSLVAAETANNSAILSSTLPLFVLGVPSGASEALLFEIAASKLFYFTENFTYDLFIYTIVPALLITNFCAFMIAWPFAKAVLFLQRVPVKYINMFCFCVLLFLNLYLGYYNWAVTYYLVLFAICMIIGYLLRKQDTLPLIFTFILSGHITSLSYSLPDLLAIDLRLLLG